MHRPRSSRSGQRPRASYGRTRWPAGAPGAGKASSRGTAASVSRSSGSTWTKCDVEQQAQQSPHGVPESPAPASAARISRSQAENSPAGKARLSSTLLTGVSRPRTASRSRRRRRGPAPGRMLPGRASCGAALQEALVDRDREGGHAQGFAARGLARQALPALADEARRSPHGRVALEVLPSGMTEAPALDLLPDGRLCRRRRPPPRRSCSRRCGRPAVCRRRWCSGRRRASGSIRARRSRARGCRAAARAPGAGIGEGCGRALASLRAARE